MPDSVEPTKTAEDVVREGRQAERLLKDELLMGTLVEIEEKYLDNFRKGERPETEQFYWQMRAVDDLRQELRIKLDRGTVEQERARQRE